MDISSKSLIKKIVDEKIPCIFVSPHLDDAILSAGDLISYLSDKTTVEVANVFTEASPRPYTLSARAFLGQCGYTNAHKLFEDRIAEDKEVFAQIDIKPHYLGFVDATWRKIKNGPWLMRWIGKYIAEFNQIYPIYRLHIANGKISKLDDHTIADISQELNKIIKKYPEAYVFCPLGDHSHVDHKVVRKACEKTFHNNIVYWSDFPYNIRHTDMADFSSEIIVNNLPLSKFTWQKEIETKEKLIRGYKSQFLPLFPDNKIPQVDEVYYAAQDNVLIGNKKTVSIGISAFNEEGNIQSLLSLLLEQEVASADLKEIIVISDGSDDKTVEEVLSLDNPMVKLIDSHERKGKSARLNELSHIAESDILIILDADTRPEDNKFIEHLIRPLVNDNSYGLTVPRAIPLPGHTFFEKVLVNSHHLKTEIYHEINNGNNIYFSHGVARAMSKHFYKNIVLPIDMPEDAFAYIECIRQGFKFTYVSDAVLRFRVPSHLKDHIKQSSRFFGGQSKLTKLLNTSLLKQAYRIPVSILIRKVLKFFFIRPIETSVYLVTVLIIRLRANESSYTSRWNTSSSTKQLDKIYKKKIIFSNYDEPHNPYYGGGGALATHQVAKRLAEHYDVTILCGAFKGCADRVEDGVQYRHIGFKDLSSHAGQIMFSALLPFKVLTTKFDMWFENFVPPHSTNYLPLFTRKPVIGVTSLLHAKNFSNKYKFPFHAVEYLGLKTYKNIIALSEGSAHRIRQANAKAVIHIIPRGIDSEFLTYPTQDGDYGLCLGRIDIYQKGLDMLLHAIADSDDKSIKLVIAGTGKASEEKRLRDLIRKLNLNDRVSMVGRVEGKQKMDLLANARFVALPSRFEGFSNTALEALAMGKPLIRSDIRELKWMPDDTVLTFKNPEELKMNLAKVSSNSDMRKDLSSKARSFAMNFDWKIIVEQFKKLIKENI